MTPTHIPFEAYGVVCGVTVEHSCTPTTCRVRDLADRVLERLPPGASETSATDPTGEVTIECHGDRLTVIDSDGTEREFAEIPDALHVLDGAIRSIVAVRAPGLVFIHAGAVALDGRALVLPGRSMTGKTTLVAALVGAGATYLSDEYAVFDTEGRVHPYPRRLSLRTPAGRREVAVGELGGTTARVPLPVGLVASITFESGATMELTSNDQATCAEALISNAVAARIRPAEVVGLAANVARTTRCLSGARGEADTAAQRLLECFAADVTGSGR